MKDASKESISVSTFTASLKEKDGEIALPKDTLKHSKPTDTVDLSSNDTNLCNSTKEQGEEAPKSNIVIQLKQQQAMLQVKQEENDAKSELEDIMEGLDVANDILTQQAVHTNSCQNTFDEVYTLADANGVDG